MECTLCQQALALHPIIDQDLPFCCHGCQAVFSILMAKGETGSFKDNPLFHQAVKSGLISNPDLLERLHAKNENASSDEPSTKFYFEISEMWCPSCAEVIRLVLLQEKGIKNCHIDYMTDMASVEFMPKFISQEKIFQSIHLLGYQPNRLEDREQKTASRHLYLRFIIASFCALNAMMFAYPLYAIHFDVEGEEYAKLFAWLSFIVALPVVTYTGWPIFRRCWSALCVGLVGMETLVTLGVAAAFGLSTFELFSGGTRVYFDSMSVIIAFVLLGKIIENQAKFTAKESLFRLNLALPKRGRKRLSNESSSYVPVKDLAVGDILEVRMGEMVVLDGTVIDGEGVCNESVMTGESIPIAKSKGSAVIGGSFLQHGFLLISITAISEQSTLQRIVSIIEKQISGKSGYTRPADAIVKWFVPFVAGLALMTLFICLIFGISDAGKTVQETAFIRAIAVLLISCPCAIGIAAPTAESELIHALASCGVLVRNRGCLNDLGKATFVVFDKTGTITAGKFAVLEGLEKVSSEDQAVLKGMVERSNHPIAYALNEALIHKPAKLDYIEEILGKGIYAEVFGRQYRLGSKKFAANNLEESENEGMTTVYFCKEKDVISIRLNDQIKQHAYKLAQQLFPVKTALVSGDGEAVVAHVARACQFGSYLSQASPLEKQRYIEDLKQQREIVLMVGDGVNDAPALTTAHVGLSVMTASDVSVQVSDLLLTTDKLAVIPEILKLSKMGIRIVRQNLFWAFFYNVIGIGLAMSGLLSPIFAAFAMTASSLIVLFNAKRLRHKRINKLNRIRESAPPAG